MHFLTVDTPLLAVAAMVAGFVLLIKGGNWTVDSAVFLAKKFGVSSLIVGFTIVAFGTSLPELLVSVMANLDGSPGIAIGNVLGSNIANVLMVLGATAVFAPLVVSSPGIFKDLIMMIVATAILMVLMLSGEISRMAGIGMVALLAGYVFLQYRMAIKGEIETEDDTNVPDFKNKVMPYAMLALGLVSVSLGADFLVKGAKFSAAYIGVPDAVIALSVIALGTSLPELSTCIISVRKGHSDMALGNIIGSNVFNILVIMGITSIVKPIASGSFAAQLVDFDIWVTVAVSFLLMLILLAFRKIARPVGVMFILGYVVYNVYIYAIYMGA